MPDPNSNFDDVIIISSPAHHERFTTRTRTKATARKPLNRTNGHEVTIAPDAVNASTQQPTTRRATRSNTAALPPEDKGGDGNDTEPATDVDGEGDDIAVVIRQTRSTTRKAREASATPAPETKKPPSRSRRTAATTATTTATLADANRTVTAVAGSSRTKKRTIPNRTDSVVIVEDSRMGTLQTALNAIASGSDSHTQPERGKHRAVVRKRMVQRVASVVIVEDSTQGSQTPAAPAPADTKGKGKEREPGTRNASQSQDPNARPRRTHTTLAKKRKPSWDNSVIIVVDDDSHDEDGDTPMLDARGGGDSEAQEAKQKGKQPLFLPGSDGEDDDDDNVGVPPTLPLTIRRGEASGPAHATHPVQQLHSPPRPAPVNQAPPPAQDDALALQRNYAMLDLVEKDQNPALPAQDGDGVDAHAYEWMDVDEIPDMDVPPVPAPTFAPTQTLAAAHPPATGAGAPTEAQEAPLAGPPPAPQIPLPDASLTRILEIVPDVLPTHASALLDDQVNQALAVPVTEGQYIPGPGGEAQADEGFLRKIYDVSVQRVLHILFEDPGYPKIERNKGKGKRVEEAVPEEKEKKKPKIDYGSKDRKWVGGEHYHALAIEQLMTDFPYIPKAHITRRLVSSNYFYAPTYFVLLEDSGTHPLPYARKITAYRSKGKGTLLRDEDFEEERRWVVQKISGEAEAGAIQGSAAGAAGDDAAGEPVIESEECEDGIECGCCFTPYTFESMIQCPDAHLFCKSCMLSYASNLLGEHNPNITCMDQSSCKLHFTLSELQRFLTPKLLDLYHRVKQSKEIELAGLDGLEECPFCEYKCVIENPEERLFRCENVDQCGVVSCRGCKKEDHLPKTCKEVEEEKHLDGQHAVEEAMSRALMRNCPKCNKAFIKESGCNKMTCPNCHTLSCYVCREIIKGYEHFTNNPRCVLHDPVERRAAAEVKEAADKALRDYKEQHPEFDENAVKVDVPKDEPAPPNPYGVGGVIGMMRMGMGMGGGGGGVGLGGLGAGGLGMGGLVDRHREALDAVRRAHLAAVAALPQLPPRPPRPPPPPDHHRMVMDRLDVQGQQVAAQMRALGIPGWEDIARQYAAPIVNRPPPPPPPVAQAPAHYQPAPAFLHHPALIHQPVPLQPQPRRRVVGGRARRR